MGVNLEYKYSSTISQIYNRGIHTVIYNIFEWVIMVRHTFEVSRVYISGLYNNLLWIVIINFNIIGMENSIGLII
jgi:hypothetical protein